MKTVVAFKIIHQMETTHRYSNTHLSERENILQHTGFVATYSAVLVHQFVDKFTNTSMYTSLLKHHGLLSSNELIADVLTKSVIHDIEETVTGDIVRPVKYHSPESIKLFKAMEDEAALSVLTRLGVPQLHSHWRNDKDELSGMFVRVADIMAVVYKLYTECALCGTYSILKACGQLKSYINDVIKMVDDDYLPITVYPAMNRFINEVLNEGLTIVSTIESSVPRLASIDKLDD